MKKIFMMAVLMCTIVACTGADGSNGHNGVNGDPGMSANCTVTTVSANTEAPNGGALITCSDASQVLILNGTNGVDGSPGVLGPVITPVQFCKNSHPHYPSVFPEVGFIINGNLYAVYSANGGFMTLITPGRYESDGIGSSCDFTVNSDNSITQN